MNGNDDQSVGARGDRAKGDGEPPGTSGVDHRLGRRMSAAGWVATIRLLDSGGLIWLGKGHGSASEAQAHGREAHIRLERIMGKGVIGPVEVVDKGACPDPPPNEVTVVASEMTAGEIVAELRRLTDAMIRQFDRLIKDMNQQRKG